MTQAKGNEQCTHSAQTVVILLNVLIKNLFLYNLRLGWLLFRKRVYDHQVIRSQESIHFILKVGLLRAQWKAAENTGGGNDALYSRLIDRATLVPPHGLPVCNLVGLSVVPRYSLHVSCFLRGAAGVQALEGQSFTRPNDLCYP